MDRIYLDHNATTPMRPQVRDRMVDAFEMIGNPSSMHREGREARGAIEVARSEVAALVGGRDSGVVFTSGATEANMLALTPHMKRLYKPVPASHLYISAIEHPSVLTGGRFADEDVSLIPVSQSGVVDLDRLADLLREHDQEAGKAYISVMAVNSETGVIQPIRAIAQLAKEFGAYCHIDAVQAAGKIPLDMEDIGCSSIAISGHKFGGPKGIGALILGEEGLEPEPLILGGAQENRLRAGTENVAAIVGFGAACKLVKEELDRSLDESADGRVDKTLVKAEGLAKGYERWRALRDGFEERLMQIEPDCVVFGKDAMRVPHCSQFAIPGQKAETMLIQLDLAGIAVSSGSACSSGKVAASHVLEAMGFEANITEAAIRVSLGWNSENSDLDAILSQLEKISGKNSRNGLLSHC